MLTADFTIDNLPAPAWMTALAGRLVAGLRAAGIPDPLTEPLTLACVLADLFALANVPVPADVRVRIEAS